MESEIQAAEAGSLPSIRPLVVPTRFAPDESLIGAVAASTRANVLKHLNVILSEVGLPLLRPGVVGQELGGLAPRLAEKLGCDVQDVVLRQHPYLAEPISAGRGGGNLWLPVRWGSGVLLRQHLDLKTRRISPRALRRRHITARTGSASSCPTAPRRSISSSTRATPAAQSWHGSSVGVSASVKDVEPW